MSKPLPALASQPLGSRELIAMVASLMALNALAIDLMLPALGQIARDLGVLDPNDQQLVVVAYVLGFGAPQIVFGPVADRVGRRPVLFVSLIGYAIAGVACMLAPNFELLLTMRFAQGVCAAGCRVVAVAIVRDLYVGRGMARIMSLVMTVFMVIPIIAPALGQAILWVAPWRWCFGVLVVASVLLLAWVALRLNETLPAPIPLRSVGASYRAVLRHRVTLGYTLASGLAFGSLFAFISACEQIFREVFHQGETFALWFAGIAFVLTIANFANSRLVERFGMRRLGHFALIGFTATAAILLVVMRVFGEHLFIFFPLFSLCFAFFGLIGANFNAMAMEPLGRVAGTASAAYGFATTTISGVIGGLVARAYDGTTTPILLGFVVLGVLSLIIVLITERGRLFGDESREVLESLAVTRPG